MEADDLGTYVVKYTGAGQGRKALVAEVIAAGLARALSLPVPELVFVELDSVLGRAEPDEEVQDLLRASPGLNLGMDFLPGSLGFDPLVHEVAPLLASSVLWFDALIDNVDRSWRNPNLLRWHGGLWLIDHGASLVFHHSWARAFAAATKPYDASQHVLRTRATELLRAAELLPPLLTSDALRAAVDDVPKVWLEDEPGFGSAAQVRQDYVEHLEGRLASAPAWQP